MIRNVRQRNTNRRRRFSALAVGVGTAAGGMLFAAISQLALAPSAQAQPDDRFADVFSEIQIDIAAGQHDFSDATSALVNGDVVAGLTLDLTGVDNQVFGSGLDLVVDGTEALTGNPDTGGFAFTGFAIPADFDAGIDEAQQYISDSQLAFGTALTDFSAGELSSGLENAAFGTEDLLVYAPNEVVLGLAESLLGAPSSSDLDAVSFATVVLEWPYRGRMSEHSHAITISHPPKAVLRVVNPALRLLLRTPLRGPVGKELMVLSFTGRKTGRRYSIPLSAHHIDGTLYAITGARWKNNFRGGATAEVLHDGKTATVRGELIDDRATVADLAYRASQAYGAKRAQRALGVKFRDQHVPSPAEFAEAVGREHLAAIRFTPAT